MAKETTATTAVARAKPAAQMQVPWGEAGKAQAPPVAGKKGAGALKIPTQSDLVGGGPGTSLALTAVKQIVALTRRMMAEEDEIARLSGELEAHNKVLTRLRMFDVPDAMREAGSKAITLEGGEVVEVKDFITGNIKEENREAAHAWLRANGFGSLVKHVVACAFGMGEDKKALAVIKWLAGKKIPFEQKEAVNTNTLRAFVRERLEAGKALPPSIDYTAVPTATVKRPKKEQ